MQTHAFEIFSIRVWMFFCTSSRSNYVSVSVRLRLSFSWRAFFSSCKEARVIFIASTFGPFFPGYGLAACFGCSGTLRGGGSCLSASAAALASAGSGLSSSYTTLGCAGSLVDGQVTVDDCSLLDWLFSGLLNVIVEFSKLSCFLIPLKTSLSC